LPVWVTLPDSAIAVSNILVASDLHAVSEIALRAGAALASATGAKLRLLHAVEYPLDRIRLSKIDQRTEHYHRNVDDDARRTLDQHIASLGDAGVAIEIDLVDGARGADLAILRDIEAHQVDLLVMGTVGRSGMAGALIGNTAERLVHQVPCSILAVKPEGFRCPLTLDPPL
jgi:universal stress protein E